MKVIHTYATGNTGGPIMKNNFFLAILSAYYAKKSYGNITLYGDRALIKPLQDLGFDYLYDEIIEGEYHKAYLGAWSMPKVMTFASINEPFMHIDTDTIFYKPIDFSKLDRHTANLFCYRDQAQKDFSDECDGDILTKFMTQEWGYDAQYRTYLNYLFKYWNNLDPVFKAAFDMNSIPNMNIVYAQDYDLINEAAQLTIDFFNENKETLEKDRGAACFLEQLMVHQWMRVLDSDYKKASTAGDHVLYENEPFQRWDMDDFETNEEIGDYTNSYPFSYNYEKVCEECNVNHDIKVKINSESEIDKFYNDDMGGFFHMTNNKRAPLMQSYMYHQLERIIGLERIQEIWRYYHPFLTKIQHPTKDPGEYLFERHKQEKVFYL